MTTEELLKLTVETLDKKKGMDIKALKAVSYTHLDVYKRQPQLRAEFSQSRGSTTNTAL